ncbi:c-type cytochrome [Neisseria perflava]|uniref:c-type cytochrome n=1 Tax=Neisseria perflava TaxID=33053 RepID=UPI00209CFD7D|nr:cytochrome c [Neisseria perflava]MCP1659987.1 cytochrome c556 [Neisseria perflava]MCP1771996.1 cytochrome c556 [Neisseria perflava]
MNKTLLALATLSALLLGACGGQADQSAAASSAPVAQIAASDAQASAISPIAAVGATEDVNERERLMKLFKENFGVMGKMVKGDVDFNAAAFQTAAGILNENADKPWAHYTEESATLESEAKPEVWTKAAEFKKEADHFVIAVAALNTAAKEGTLEAVKAPFGEVGQSCKSCHSTFRKD